MKYYMEEESRVTGECEECGRVHHVKRTQLKTTSWGFRLSRSFRCPCSEMQRSIVGGPHATSSPPKAEVKKTGQPNTPNAWAGSLGCLVIVVVIFLIARAMGGNSGSSGDILAPGRVVASPPAAPAAPLPAGSQWDYSQQTDEMTGRASHTAGVLSVNTVEFGFPYGGAQHGLLAIRRHPRFGSNVIFRIERGQLLCDSYDGCTVLVRFDEGEALRFSANAAADHSSETLFIANYDRFLSKMRTARQVRISPRVYQEGDVVFTFDVSGFDSKRLQGQ